MEYGMPGTKVSKCGGSNCKSSFQDEKYGNDMRVMNHAPNKGSAKDRYRCTVCKKEHKLS